MELSSFSENIVIETFERSGEIVQLKINRDAVVPAYSDVVEERLAPTIKQLETLMAQHLELTAEIEALEKKDTAKKSKAKKIHEPIDFNRLVTRLKDIQRGIDEVKREIYAERLTCPVSLPDGSSTCILKGWDITENGLSIEPSKGNLLRLPTAAVEALFEFVMSKIETVKKKVESGTSIATSENAHGGSAVLRVVGQNT